MLPVIGYEYLLSRIGLRMPPLVPPAQVRPVRAYRQIDREFDLPNRTVNLLIQWIRQNQGRMPERRRNATGLLLFTSQQIERIEAIVARCFQRNDRGSRDAHR